MIDDLLTDLTIGAVERILTASGPSGDAETALARLNARLTRREESRERGTREPAPSSGPEAETHVLSAYLDLPGGDLLQIPVSVHEWLLERLSNGPLGLVPAQVPALIFLYQSFPATTIRHAIVGLFIQGDGDGDWLERGIRSPAQILIRGITRGEPPPEPGAQDPRLSEVLTFVDLLLDFADTHPEETVRALRTLLAEWSGETVRQHVRDWAARFGGETGNAINRLASDVG